MVEPGAQSVGKWPMHPSILVVDDNADHLELTVMALAEYCDAREVATMTDGANRAPLAVERMAEMSAPKNSTWMGNGVRSRISVGRMSW